MLHLLCQRLFELTQLSEKGKQNGYTTQAVQNVTQLTRSAKLCALKHGSTATLFHSSFVHCVVQHSASSCLDTISFQYLEVMFLK